MENLIDLIAFVILVCYYIEAFSFRCFAACNSQLQGITVIPPALFLFAHLCVATGFNDAFGLLVIILKRICNY